MQINKQISEERNETIELERITKEKIDAAILDMVDRNTHTKIKFLNLSCFKGLNCCNEDYTLCFMPSKSDENAVENKKKFGPFAIAIVAFGIFTMPLFCVGVIILILGCMLLRDHHKEENCPQKESEFKKERLKCISFWVSVLALSIEIIALIITVILAVFLK